MGDWAENGDWAVNGDWAGILAGDSILKIQLETAQASESDLRIFGTPLLKEISETIQLSESDLNVIELAPTGHTGWGIPIGI